MTKRAPLKIPADLDLSVFNDAIIRSNGVDRITSGSGTLLPKCRSGCPTQDHKSYSECARGIQVNTGLSLATGQKAHDAELRAYKRARSQGVQPVGTQMHQVEQAMRISDATGVAFGG